MLASRKFGIFTVQLGLALALSGCGGGGSSSNSKQAVSLASAPVIVAANPLAEKSLPVLEADSYTPPRQNKSKMAGAVEKTAEKNAQKSARPSPALIDLGAPAGDKVSSIMKSASQSGKTAAGTPLQIGFSREIDKALKSKASTSAADWQPTSSGGSAVSFQFRSLDAVGMRLGMLIKSLSPKAVVRFYAPGADTTQEVSGVEILQVIQRNLDSGDNSDDARTYWGPLVAGQHGIVEIELPAGEPASGTQVSVPRISHFFLDPLSKESLASDYKALSGSCNLDVNCATPVSPAANAVAKMSFTKGGVSYSCTGTLMNDLGSSEIPYFLTANHCIDTQTAASTLTTYWFYRASGCNSTLVDARYQLVYGGASMLWNRSGVSTASDQSGTDTSFMRLNRAPPAGALFAGWSAIPQGVGAGFTGIHHPVGDVQKISRGSHIGYWWADGAYSYTGQADAPMYQVQWYSGTTEGGSSGSGIFVGGQSANPQLVGTLTGGAASCTNPGGADVYGRFDKPFNAALNIWLAPAASPVFRLYNNNNSVHFFTISAPERNNVRNTLPQYTYEGAPFYAFVAPGAGLAPVNRFYNRTSGTHFFTISAFETAWVLANLPNMQSEGIGWYASETPQAGFIPLYRFYRLDQGTHFYTSSAGERDSIIANLGSYYRNEGIAYYVKPQPSL